MVDNTLFFLRKFVAIVSLVFSLLFIVKSIYYGYKYLDGIYLTKKSLRTSTFYLFLGSIFILIAYFIYALPSINNLILSLVIVISFFILYYLCGLISIFIGSKISKYLKR